jgi:hypothetical protein
VPIWPRVLVALGAAKVVFTFAIFFSDPTTAGASPPLPLGVYGVLAAAFCLVGLTLAAANRHDARALWLGGAFVLASAQLSTPLLRGAASRGFEWLLSVRVDAFLPALLLRFAAEFPSRLTGRAERAARLAWQTAGGIGLALMLVSLSALAWPPAPPDWRVPFIRLVGARSYYYLPVYALSIAALLWLVLRAWGARAQERQRVFVFTAGLVGGSLPLILQVLLESFPAYRAFSHRPGVELAVGVVLFGALAAVPFVTAYSVLFDRVVELRVVLRAALQYGLARYTILGLTLVPFAALVLVLVEHREEPIAGLLTGPRTVALGLTTAAGFAALRLRRGWLAALDRRYFRDRHDARATLERLTHDALRVVDTRDLAARIRDAIERSLHADASLFVADEARGLFERPGGGPDVIAEDAILVKLAAADKEPMDVDPSNDRSPFRRLPVQEQRWLIDGAFRLLLVLRNPEGRAVGLIALTQKRSGIEYTDEDRQLLAAVGAATSLALDNLRLRTTPDVAPSPTARECEACARVSRPDAALCQCGARTVPGSAPYTLRGVYRLERRLGIGGMGIVYLARDLELDRPVAVKTLPRVTSEGAASLRAEARAMAAVTHPNLAVVYGVETWRGVPFLVEEYLPGGTLADRLADGPIAIAASLELGLTLTDVLSRLHDRGIIHCDVKPGNIGFTQAGVPKLLDFGVAQLLRAAESASEDTTRGGDARRRRERAHALVGTPAYMSPEALLGQPPRPAFDLWALSVVLYEAITGMRPFPGPRDGMVVVPEPPPPPGTLREGVPREVDAFFARAFSPEPADRYADAPAVEQELLRLKPLMG